MTNAITALLSVQYPIIQAGMVWCSGWRLATASSNAGILGVIGSGSMYPEILDQHITKCKIFTNRPFGVNIPLIYPEVAKHVDAVIRHQVPVVITSAGNPDLHTARMLDAGITVLHVVSSAKFAEKAQRAGVQGIICEGFEAGGHNGRDETTAMCLVPQVRSATDLPLIAAGGIGSGAAMFAAMALGADGVQIGSLFAAAEESSAHDAFKQAVISAGEGDTILTLKELAPVRLMKNEFYNQVVEAYRNGASPDDLRAILGRGRAKKGIFEGDLVQGELEIGQVSAAIDAVRPAAHIVNRLVREFNATALRMGDFSL